MKLESRIPGFVASGPTFSSSELICQSGGMARKAELQRVERQAKRKLDRVAQAFE